jgi:threonyl-tRNA synthetase
MHLSSDHDLISQRLLAAQLLGLVVWQLFPDITLAGGGINSLGFYYDFILEQPLTETMLELIEVHLHRFIKEEHPVRFISMMRENAQSLFEHYHHILLAQQVGEQNSNILELVQVEDFYGLCPQLSLVSTLEVGYVKLLDSQEFMQEINGEEIRITRLIGTSQQSARDLKSFIKQYELFLKKRDHRSLGPRLKLFSFSESMGVLGVQWHFKGLRLRRLLQDWLDRQLPENEKQISTPVAVRQNFLMPDSFALNPFIFEGQEYRLRSSPLRQHLEFLQNFPKDLEELPWRITEYASVYRQYPESQWWGLFCTCAYLMDHTTICCTKEQVASELISSLHFIEQIITIFGFEAQWYLIAFRQKSLKARREQKSIGWLRQAIQASPRSYSFFPELQEEEEGESPRLELRVRDAVGREWPASTLGIVQQRQEATSLSVQQVKEQPQLVVLARQIWGSLDRFIALLVERYEGALPLWLVPEQVRVIAIGEANQAYARQVSQRLQQKGLRVGLDVRQAKLSIKVHEAEKENVPYLILLGEQERIKQKISIRVAGKGDHNQSVDLETFLNKLYQESLSPMPMMERTTMLKGESESA